MNRPTFLIITAVVTAGALICLAAYRRGGGEVGMSDVEFYAAAAVILALPHLRVLARGKGCGRG